MKIGIYPGSFDPIHLGHIKIVNKILEDKIVDKVLIVPTGDYWEKNVSTSILDRIKMAKIFESDQILIETKDNQIKATYDFIKLKEFEYPNDEFYLIVGGDNIVNIDKWVNYSKLLEYPFIVIGRDNYNKDYINTRFKALNKSNFVILDTENIDISSTQIREELSNREYPDTLLDRRVYEYIIDNNLYI